jgi:molybdate transport system substrate-binding protein
MKKLLVYIMVGLMVLCGSYIIAGEKPLTIFAAASSAEAAEESGREFTVASGISIRVNPGSSGRLVRQMEQSAEVDVFISASKAWMDHAKIGGLLKNSTVCVLMSGALAIVAPKDSGIETFEPNVDIDFPASFHGRLSIGDPRHVPAGKYAMETLKYYKWDKAFESRLLPAMDARSALMVVEQGEADAGIVFLTDARKSQRIKILAILPGKSHSPVVYYAAVCKGASPGAEKLLEFMCRGKGIEIFKKHGFMALPKK